MFPDDNVTYGELLYVMQLLQVCITNHMVNSPMVDLLGMY